MAQTWVYAKCSSLFVHIYSTKKVKEIVFEGL